MNWDAQMFMGAVDLILIFAIVILLSYALFQRSLVPRHKSTSGRYLTITGIAIMLVAEMIDLVLSAFQSSSLLSVTSTGSLHWLLSRTVFALVVVGVPLAIFQRRQLEEAISKSDQKIKAVADSTMESEERFGYMIETTSDSVYCFTFDPPMSIALSIAEQVERSHESILTACNRTFAIELGAEHSSEFVGRRMGNMHSNNDATTYFEYFRAFIENDYRLTDYELIYKTPSGEDRALLISLTGFVRDGYLHKMWGSETNILDRRQTEVALDARRRSQELLADISSRLVMTDDQDADEVIQDCLQEVCQFIGSDRTTLLWLDLENESGEVSYFWSESETNIPTMISTVDFPWSTDELIRSEALCIDDVDDLPAEAETDRRSYRKRELKSYAAVPIRVAGKIVGAVTFGNTRKKRKWTDQDILDLRVFSELFCNYVLRLKSHRALDDALADLRKATAKLEAENVYLRQEIKTSHRFNEIIGQSDALLDSLRKVEQVAATTTSVLILGETGTGKELIARAIHEHSDRSDRPLVKVNCAALPANLIESELFGYKKGAFTGAESSKRGRFDLADKGTLFLDEIGDIPIDLQPKLLRVLQEGEFQRLGGSKTVRVNVRIIVATNRNLLDAVDRGEFRSDLFYRINTFPITLPALRDRQGDIQLLVEHFVKVHSQRLGRDVTAISAAMMRQLDENLWPGNIRELEGVIQRALISGTGPILELAESLRTRTKSDVSELPEVISTSIADLRVVEREHILCVLEEARWKISGKSGAASKLGVPASTLRSKMKKLSITRPH